MKTKRPGRHLARDFYDSTLFSGRRAYAEAQGLPWFILSPRYGLLSPDEEVNDYDLALTDLPAKARREWSQAGAQGAGS